MPTNLFVNNYDVSGEQRLISELTQEAIAFNGIDVIYAPRTFVNEDKLLGEDTLNAFNQAFQIEMYIESIDGFAGEQDIITKFGYEVRDEVQLTVSQTKFSDITGLDKPNEGDLIYFPLSGGLFEIKFTQDEEPFYPRGQVTSFKLTCELYQYSGEKLDTGVVNIDAVEDDFDNIDSTVNDPFADNPIFDTESTGVIDFSEDNPFGDKF